jgi:hypothetical protein
MLGGRRSGQNQAFEQTRDSVRRQARLVEAWAELRQAELIADWERLQAGTEPLPIDPLP